MERPSLPEVPLLHGLHSTLSLSGATEISRYLIRAKWDMGQGGGREEGADLGLCVTVLPRVVLLLAGLSPQTRYI